jgi:hypothetical protein
MKEQFKVIEIENQTMKLKVNRSSGCLQSNKITNFYPILQRFVKYRILFEIIRQYPRATATACLTTVAT